VAVTYFFENRIPNYICLSTDVVGGKVSGINTIGSRVHFTDTNTDWYVGDDLTLIQGSVASISLSQNVVADPYNSSTANLAASAVFSGSATSTLGVAGIQVSLYTNQNCDVWVEQSPDGNNWDISDQYKYYSGVNNFGITTQAINSYCRVRVKNLGTITTGSFRLQTALCPIVEALPRSLTQGGNLKVAVQEIEDGYGFGVENTPTDEMRVVIPYRLVGSSFTGSVIDTNYWISNSGSTSGSIVPLGSQVILTTGSFSGGSCVLQSFRVARYIGGASSKFRTVIRLPDIGTAGNTRRWGAFTSTDGAFFQLSGSSLSVVTRKTSVDTPVLSGAFNGNVGSTFALDTNVKTWEIYWTNSKVWFTAGGEVIHLVTANADIWSDTMNLPIRFENSSSSSGSSVNMHVRVATIYRLGNSISQPTSYYHAAGQTAGVNLKIGAGNIHSIVLGTCLQNCVLSLVDSVNAATPVIFSTGAITANSQPISLDLKGLPFFTGLRLVVATANGVATVIYE
jgi:hypothetical protein